MGVQFTVAGESVNWEDPAEGSFVDVSNSNAVELLRWLGYEVDGSDLCGMLAPADLITRCKRRLEPTPRNIAGDLPRAQVSRRMRGPDGNPGARVIECGREMGYLHRRTEDLLKLAERAGDRFISYS